VSQLNIALMLTDFVFLNLNITNVSRTTICEAASFKTKNSI